MLFTVLNFQFKIKSYKQTTISKKWDLLVPLFQHRGLFFRHAVSKLEYLS